jgi:hypothetical protein
VTTFRAPVLRVQIASRVRDPRLLVVAVALISAGLVIAVSLGGPGLSSDSVGYAAVARNWASTGQLTYWDGAPFVLWPPGLPLLLGILIRAGIDLQVGAIMLNVASVVANIGLTYLLARHFLRSVGVAIVPAGIVALSLATIRTHQMIWTEPLFCVLCLAAVWLLVLMFETGIRPATLALVATFVSLAATVRFAGIALVPVVGISVWPTAAGRHRERSAFLIGVLGAALASVGSLVLILRNLMLGSEAFGPRPGSSYGLANAALDILATMGRWLLATSPTRPASVVGLLVAAAAVLGGVVLFRRRPATVVPLVAFVASYLALLLASALFSEIDPIAERFMSPVFGPTTILVVVAVEAVWLFTTASSTAGLVRRHGPRAARAATVAAGVVLFGSNGLGILGFAAESSRSGVGFNAIDVRSSELASAVGHLPGTAGVASNDPITLYWVTGRYPVIGRGQSLGAADPAPSIRASVASGESWYYAQFSGLRTDQGLSIEALRESGLRLQEVARLQDGVLYALIAQP